MSLLDALGNGRWGSVMAGISRIAVRVVPPILEAVDDGADRTEAAARVIQRLSEKGIGPASPQTVELFAMAIASFAVDLKTAEAAAPDLRPEVRRG